MKGRDQKKFLLLWKRHLLEINTFCMWNEHNVVAKPNPLFPVAQAQWYAKVA